MYKSEKQRKFFHTDTAKEQGNTEKVISEFDKTSKGKKLPEYAFKRLKSKLKGSNK